METSLRYNGESKSLRIHAKEKYPLDLNTHLQLHAELDTRIGAPPSFLCAMIRHSFPQFYAGISVGAKFNKQEKLRLFARAKKAFPFTIDGLKSFIVKGRCEADEEFKQIKPKGAAEFSWSIRDFKKDQDVRIKLGYEISDQMVQIASSRRKLNSSWQLNGVSYIQIRENNWTLNVDSNRKWNLRYDL
ncbi:hypothetical protein LIER_03287 [Lithospermum erythrorhizon]|uniref:Uncharacterized protein n=1 Tax=Lithospermum erythrorhizon TaxID=34254 RepID=A0AAV3NTS9_LITER